MGLCSAEMTRSNRHLNHWFVPSAVICHHFIFETSGRSYSMALIVSFLSKSEQQPTTSHVKYRNFCQALASSFWHHLSPLFFSRYLLHLLVKFTLYKTSPIKILPVLQILSHTTSFTLPPICKWFLSPETPLHVKASVSILSLCTHRGQVLCRCYLTSGFPWKLGSIIPTHETVVRI